jgi:hypothetical protein
MTSKSTYSVRTGDDAKWEGEYDRHGAVVAAMELAQAKNGNAVVRNNATGHIAGRISECRWAHVAADLRWY